jgi:hypothetical protein
MPAGCRICASLDLSYAPPKNVCRITVLLVACDYAAFAADAFRHVEMKSVLLARGRNPQRYRRRTGSTERTSRSLFFFRRKKREVRDIELLHAFE